MIKNISPFTSKSNEIHDYHIHTFYDDGQAPPQLMARRASELGICSLGFCVHSPLPYPTEWACTRENFPKYIREIQELKEEYKGKMNILLGVEYDLDSEMLSNKIELDRFDFVIGAAHQLHGLSGEVLEIDNKDAIPILFSIYGDEETIIKYFNGVFAVSQIPQVDIIAHFDLILKCAEYLIQNPFYRNIAIHTVRRILNARPDIFFELNTGGMYRAGKIFPYPALFILEEIKRLGGRIVINSDAHSEKSIAYARDIAINTATLAGF